MHSGYDFDLMDISCDLIYIFSKLTCKIRHFSRIVIGEAKKNAYFQE